MPIPIIDVDDFTDVTVPADGDPVDAAHTDPPGQDLANRTRYLLNVIARDQFHNWEDRSAEFNAAVSAGTIILHKPIYDNGSMPSQRPQILVIGRTISANPPPAMLSYSGDGWFDASSGITGNNRSDNDAVFAGSTINKWVIVGGDGSGGSKIHTHARDLSTGTWTAQTAADNVEWLGVAVGPGMPAPLVIVGVTGKINSSLDGVTWTSRTSGTANDLKSIAFSLGGLSSVYVAVGANGTIVSSADGQTWTVRTSPTAANFVGVVWDPVNAKFVAATGTGVIITSPDGTTWTTATSPADYTTPGLAISGIATDGSGRVALWHNYQQGSTPAGIEGWLSFDAGTTWDVRPFQIVAQQGTAILGLAKCNRLGWLAVGAGASANIVYQSSRVNA